MRKFKFLFLSALMVTGLVTFTACGMGNANDTSKPPYEDETNTNNNTGNTGDTNNIGDDIKNGVDDIGDDIQNGIDNVEDGIQNGIDDIQNGMDDMQDGSQDNGGDMNNRGHRTSRLEEAGQNFMESVREASNAIKDGIMQLNGMK